MLSEFIAIAGICSILNEDYHLDEPLTVYEINENAPAEDVDILARLITAEMGYDKEPEVYHLAGAVVWNRMKSDDFPDTLEEVIYQKGQYLCTWNGHIEREPDPVAVDVANDLLLNGTQVPENVVFQAEFLQGSGVYEHINNTYFCYQ